MVVFFVKLVKKDAWFTIPCAFVIFILNRFSNYANCITSSSSSLISFSISSGKNSLISSTVISPFFNISNAFSLETTQKKLDKSRRTA